MFLFLLFVTTVVYLLGSYRAVEMYKERVKFEKEIQRLGINYKLRRKYLGYILCGVFSWLSYSVLKRSL